MSINTSAARVINSLRSVSDTLVSEPWIVETRFLFAKDDDWKPIRGFKTEPDAVAFATSILDMLPSERQPLVRVALNV